MLSLCSVVLFSICLISAFILCMVLEFNSSEAWISDSKGKQIVLQGIVFIAVNCIFKSVQIYSSYYAEKYQMRLYVLIIHYNKYIQNKLYYFIFPLREKWHLLFCECVHCMHACILYLIISSIHWIWCDCGWYLVFNTSFLNGIIAY